jgi:hypothetical protein
MTCKSTDEIKTLLRQANLDFDLIENRALNAYLPKIFHSCPFTEDICTAKQCLECPVFNKLRKKRIREKQSARIVSNMQQPLREILFMTHVNSLTFFCQPKQQKYATTALVLRYQKKEKRNKLARQNTVR